MKTVYPTKEITIDEPCRRQAEDRPKPQTDRKNCRTTKIGFDFKYEQSGKGKKSFSIQNTKGLEFGSIFGLQF